LHDGIPNSGAAPASLIQPAATRCEDAKRYLHAPKKYLLFNLRLYRIIMIVGSIIRAASADPLPMSPGWTKLGWRRERQSIHIERSTIFDLPRPKPTIWATA
jgi:hypothetical protein